MNGCGIWVPRSLVCAGLSFAVAFVGLWLNDPGLMWLALIPFTAAVALWLVACFKFRRGNKP